MADGNRWETFIEKQAFLYDRLEGHYVQGDRTLSSLVAVAEPTGRSSGIELKNVPGR
jgi:hypothetical protein